MESANLNASLQRFHRVRSRALRFGPKEDSTILLRSFALAFLLIHGAAFGLSQVNPTHQDPMTLYFANQRLLVGLLLAAWLIGFNLINWAIWLQFESSEQSPIDDYDVTDEMTEEAGEAAGKNEVLGSRSEATMLVRMPSGEISLGSINK